MHSRCKTFFSVQKRFYFGNNLCIDVEKMCNYFLIKFQMKNILFQIWEWYIRLLEQEYPQMLINNYFIINLY